LEEKKAAEKKDEADPRTMAEGREDDRSQNHGKKGIDAR